MSKWMSPVRRGERMLADRLLELERMLDRDDKWWPEYLETYALYLKAKAALSAPSGPAITEDDLRRDLRGGGEKNPPASHAG
jgi:hypothetical protein